MTPPRLQRGLTGLLIALLLNLSGAQGELQRVDGWIAEPPPGSLILAGYLTLQNPGTESRSLVGISSPQFSRVEVHRTVIVDGLARMEALPRIDIPVGGRLNMQPGGAHLMLIDPVARLERGERVKLHLEFDDGSAQVVVLEVRSRREAGTPGGHDHHHR